MASLRTSLRAAAPLRNAARPAAAPRQAFRPVRFYSEAKGPAPGSHPPPQQGGSRSTTNRNILISSVIVAGGAAAYFLGAFDQDQKKELLGVGAEGANKLKGSKDTRKQIRENHRGQHGVGTLEDYQEVYNAIAERLEKENYDDGSFGPVLVRLAWHASGTYDKKTNTGGSNGATMRFHPEANHGANAGLIVAREFMDEIKKEFPWITYSDLWTLGGVCAVQEMGGPRVPWRPGRKDGQVEQCTPDGRLPDGDKGADHLRHIFYRMGFNDQEIVALSGAHALGRCHKDRSGFDGPWTFSPTSFTNAYYQLLFDEKWQLRKWEGPIQYEDKNSKSLMMLTTDMALTQDPSFKKHALRYAKSEEEFFKDFAAAYGRLIELGVPQENFKAFEKESDGGKKYELKTTAEQENGSQ